MRMTLNLHYIFILFLMWSGTDTYGQNKPLIVDKIIATVGNEFILYSEVQELFEYAKQQQPNYDSRLQCQIVDQLISSKLLLNQARLDSVEVSDVEVEVEIERRMQYILSQMNGSEEFFQNYYGKTPLEYREELGGPLKEELTIQKIQGQLINEVQITPQEVIDYYNLIPRDSLPFLNAEVELAEIVYKPKVNDEESAKSRKQIEELRERILNGEDFAELASVYSDDPGSGKLGGDLDWQKRGTFVPEFEAEAYNLDKGELSNIVETQFGFHLIQLLDRRGNSIHTRHILVKPNIFTSDLEKAKAEMDSIRNSIINDSLSFGYAVKRYSDKDEFSYNNAGRMRNPKTGDTFFETSELPHQIYFAIEDLEEGDITEPIEFEEREEKLFRLIKIQSKTKPHQASITEDYDRIRNFAKESKKHEYFNSWMDEKLEKTHVKINDNFKTCTNLIKYDKSLDKN
ncbi:MAG: peptidylprolyl isomerase [Saprospiraceae bacterium]